MAGPPARRPDPVVAPPPARGRDPGATVPPHLAYVAVAALLLVVCVALPAAGAWPPRSLAFADSEITEGRVTSILQREILETPGGNVRVERLAVEVAGAPVEVGRTSQASTGTPLELAPGDAVLIVTTPGPNGPVYEIRDRSRRGPVLLLTALFALAVIAVGGRQGGLSLLGLGATVLVVARFIVPAVLSGANPLATCIFGALVIMAATLTLGHGATRKTAIALVATGVSLALAGGISTWAVDLARVTGLSEDSATLQLLAGTLDVRGLLLGGIILGAVGVLDDVTTTQAATVVELRAANPALTAADLFRRGMNVGRDHIAATTNTLLLAYAGTSLPLMVILAAQDLPLGILVSFDTLATEIVRTLAGSMAIVAAVPITTALAAFDAARRPPP